MIVIFKLPLHIKNRLFWLSNNIKDFLVNYTVYLLHVQEVNGPGKLKKLNIPPNINVCNVFTFKYTTEISIASFRTSQAMKT